MRLGLAILVIFALPAHAGETVAFSPGGALDLVVHTIDQAHKQILVAAYSFTSKPIAQALLQARQRGVDVQVVADEKDNRRRYSAVTFLANAGIPVRLDGRYSIMHNKFMILDGVTVETGSFNYTAAAAAKNAENVLVLDGRPALASQYAAEWHRLWDEAIPLKPAY